MQRDLCVGVSSSCMQKLMEGEALLGNHGHGLKESASLKESKVSVREFFCPQYQPGPDYLSQLGCGGPGRSLRKDLGMSKVNS